MNPSNTTLPELIRWSTRTHGDTLALVDGDRRITYTELGDLIDQAARALVASGIEPGDVVSMWAPNRWEWVVASLATARAGCVLVPINTRYKGDEAAYVLAAAKVKMLFVANGFLGTDYVAALSGHELPDLVEVVDMSAESGAAVSGQPITPFVDFMQRGRGSDHAVEVDRRSDAVGVDDVNLVMFTSGTTGLPKGVQVRGSAIVRVAVPCVEAYDMQHGDVVVLVTPYFHAFGFNCGIVPALAKGATNVPVSVLDVTAVLELIERERVTMLPGPPALFQSLLNHPELDSFDVSSLRGCHTGGATIPVEMVLAMQQRLGFEHIVTAFGMTETSGLAAHTRKGDSPEVIARSSGRAVDDVELRVVDDDLNDVPSGSAGELLVRGYQVTPGYLNDPEKTAETITADGWLRTGDIAVIDENGYVDITDRKKDMFIMGGFNVYPAEVERVMLEHPDVGLVAVIGIRDQRMGEVGAAFVVPAPGVTIVESEMIEWCRERMANYKVPRVVHSLDALPMTASGKVQKPELRALATS
ncbi:MAG: AMP-binding protein [Ilumatobacter sp.]